ncbi:MAG TPA: hypothetical protein VG937_26655 [Polyangiaceae bacterium]|nr:hypothetical protein [Polyangiaceae bacterium]
MKSAGRWVAGLSLLLFACNVESTAGQNVGTGQPSHPGSVCPDGVTVLLSDFFSSLVALSTLDGNTQSASFLSTGSRKTDGLSFALSGDVVLPSTRTLSGRVVLVDRFGTNVITWANPSSAEVLGQLPVGTGFESNPSDYLELEDGRALVTRWGENSEPGRQAFDRGSDVLVIDSQGFQLLDSIELPRHDELPPRPSSLSRVRDLVMVTLDRLSLDFSLTGEAELVGISSATLEIEFVQRFVGLKGCGRPALSPSGKLLAVACSGSLNRKGEVSDLSESGLVLLDAESRPLRELQRFPAQTLAGAALQSSAVFASEDLLLWKTQTALGGSGNNRWLSLNVREQSLRTLLEAGPDEAGTGKGIVYGGMACAPGCSDICLLADADRGVLQRARITADGAELLSPRQVESTVGLPPRDLSLR